MLDYLIKNAKIVDGTGNAPYIGHVGIKDDVISFITDREEENSSYPAACTVIDARGKYLTPGFIDIHRHCDLKVLEPDFGILELKQGITTTIGGNCGISAAPSSKKHFQELNNYVEPLLGRNKSNYIFETYGQYISKIKNVKKNSLKLNYGGLVGNGTVRIAVKGFDHTPLRPDEMNRVKVYVEEALSSGAKGLSMGLMYAPENYYTFDELVQIAEVLHKYNGLLTVHLRGEGRSLVSSIHEVIKLAEKAEIPLHISHFKAAGRSNWKEQLTRAIDIINEYRAKGMDITCDVYPYNAGSTSLYTLLPSSLLAGGMEAMVAQLKEKSVRQKLRRDLATEHAKWDNLLYKLGWENVVISSVNKEENRGFTGKNIKEISEMTHKDEIDCICDLLVSEAGKVGMVIFHMSEEDVQTVLQLDYSMIISDSLYPDTGLPHPRLYGTFPRVLEKYIKEKKMLPIEKAVKKMTFMPAQRMSIEDRGLIKVGYKADLLLFELEKIRETSTYINPINFGEGFDHVFVNGKIAVKNNEVTGVGFGKVLMGDD